MKKYDSSIFKRLALYTKPDLKFVIAGVIGAIGNGTIFPIFSIYLSKMIGILIDMQLDRGTQK